MLKSVSFALSLLAASSYVSIGQAATSAEKAACQSDALKYCSSHIGKPAEMNKCLAANKDNLSDACRKVIEAHGG
jgi:hypothetical protein